MTDVTVHGAGLVGPIGLQVRDGNASEWYGVSTASARRIAADLVAEADRQDAAAEPPPWVPAPGDRVVIVWGNDRLSLGDLCQVIKAEDDYGDVLIQRCADQRFVYRTPGDLRPATADEIDPAPPGSDPVSKAAGAGLHLSEEELLARAWAYLEGALAEQHCELDADEREMVALGIDAGLLVLSRVLHEQVAAARAAAALRERSR